MERLTDKKEADAQRREYEIRLKQGYPRNIPEERFLRLAAYEDTGLEPGEIEQLKGEVLGLRLDKQEVEQYRALGPIDRLRELKQADDEGRCVVLKCKPNATVWFIKSAFLQHISQLRGIMYLLKGSLVMAIYIARLLRLTIKLAEVFICQI